MSSLPFRGTYRRTSNPGPLRLCSPVSPPWSHGLVHQGVGCALHCSRWGRRAACSSEDGACPDLGSQPQRCWLSPSLRPEIQGSDSSTFSVHPRLRRRHKTWVRRTPSTHSEKRDKTPHPDFASSYRFGNKELPIPGLQLPRLQPAGPQHPLPPLSWCWCAACVRPFTRSSASIFSIATRGSVTISCCADE